MQEVGKNKLILRNDCFPSMKRRMEDKSGRGRRKGSRRKKEGKKKKEALTKPVLKLELNHTKIFVKLM